MHPRLVGHLGSDQRRPDIARADGIDGNALLRRFERHRLGQPDHGMLGCHIGRLERGGTQAVRRGDIDDATPAATGHARQGGADGVKR
ncbi:hypothetical protein D3C72_2192300 [compost metagenome]